MDIGHNLCFHATIVRDLQKLAILINLATHKRNFHFENLGNFTPLLALLISFLNDAKMKIKIMITNNINLYQFVYYLNLSYFVVQLISQHSLWKPNMRASLCNVKLLCKALDRHHTLFHC